jgi:outer membrane protein assembly factor BamE (lipoprotein component of BamABCDE complex)
MKTKVKLVSLCVTTLLVSGCVNNTSLYTPQNDEKLTVAKAQNDLKTGMSSAEVIEIMGSPNIISTNNEGNEVWVYDKISTQKAQQNSNLGVGLIPSLIISGGSSNSSSASTQRTLTVIVKFDSNKKVKDIAYHTSSF